MAEGVAQFCFGEAAENEVKLDDWLSELVCDRGHRKNSIQCRSFLLDARLREHIVFGAIFLFLNSLCLIRRRRGPSKNGN